MKGIIVIAMAYLLIGLVAAPVRAADNSRAPTTKPSLEEENAQLRKEIAKLREQLYDKDLELSRLRLKQKLATLQPAVPMVPSPAPFSLAPGVPPAMPKGSIPQQFNGSTFYLVPLGDTIEPGTLRVKTVDQEESVPATIESRPIGTIDDRSGATRELIHGK